MQIGNAEKLTDAETQPDLVETGCRLCGAWFSYEVLNVSECADTYLDYIGIRYRDAKRCYVKCGKCQLIYRNPILSPFAKERLYEHFRDEALRGENAEKYINRILNLPPEKSENQEKCDFLSGFVDGDGKLLDVGTGMGVFLYQFKKEFQNWEVFGVEPTKGVSELAAARGTTIYEGYLEDVDIKQNGFDLVTSIHVLEHTDDPAAHVRALMGRMSASTLLYIETPSTKDIGHLPISHDRFMCQHDVIFSENVMQDLLTSLGLEIVTCRVFLSKRGRYNLRVLSKKA